MKSEVVAKGTPAQILEGAIDDYVRESILFLAICSNVAQAGKKDIEPAIEKFIKKYTHILNELLKKSDLAEGVDVPEQAERLMEYYQSVLHDVTMFPLLSNPTGIENN